MQIKCESTPSSLIAFLEICEDKAEGLKLQNWKVVESKSSNERFGSSQVKIIIR